MKKAFLLLSFIGLINFSFAQSVSFGLKAGLNLSNVSSSGGGLSVSTSNLTGFHIGAVADIALQKSDMFTVCSWSLQPGIIYSTKGGSLNADGESDKLTLNYLEVPVNLLIIIPVKIGKVFIGGGPYAALGLSGKTSTTGSDAESQKVTFGSGEADVKNPDFGINLLGGLRFKSGLAVSAGYGFGIANLSNESDVKTRNNGLSFSVGYFF